MKRKAQQSKLNRGIAKALRFVSKSSANVDAKGLASQIKERNRLFKPKDKWHGEEIS